MVNLNSQPFGPRTGRFRLPVAHKQEARDERRAARGPASGTQHCDSTAKHGWQCVLAAAIWLFIPLAAPVFAAPPDTAPRDAAPRDAAQKPAAAEPRNDLPGLTNFGQVSDTLSRGAQPTAKGFATLKARGVRTVVNLRAEASDRALLTGAGLRYLEISCNPWNMKDEQVVEFLKVVRDPKNQPVFVHCALGADRTGMMVGAYRMLEQNRSSDDAIKELFQFGFHPIYPQMAQYLKDFDRKAMLRKLDAAPQPKVEIIQ